MKATYNGKCLDRCGLRIHAEHDEIEAGHYGWRHQDCDRARLEAWVRERFAAGDECYEVQFKSTKSNESKDRQVAMSLYALAYANELAP